MTELSMEARALIERVGLADGPSAERRARVRRRLVEALVATGAGIGGVAPAAAASAHAGAAGAAIGTVSASKSAVTVGSIAVWLATGAGLGTLVSAPALVVRLNDAERPVAVESATERPSSPRVAEALVQAPGSAVEPPVPAPQPEPQVVPTGVPRVPSPPPAKATVPAPALAEETRLLEGAQRALAAGNAAGALALLDEHARRFPNGALGEERSAARVLSLCALGRTGEAERAAAAFAESSPRSPLLPRLRASCASAGVASTSR